MNYRLIMLNKMLAVAFAGLGVVAAFGAAFSMPERLMEHMVLITMLLALGIPALLDVVFRLTRRNAVSMKERMTSPEMGAHYFMVPLWLFNIGVGIVYFGMQRLPI